MPNTETFRFVLLGKTGNGKSMTGNTILGRNVFNFSAQSQSVTKYCQKHEANRFGKHICVVDTPGVFDTRIDNAQVQEEIKKCISLSTPGPHAIIVCVPIGRFTQEDIDAVNFFVKHFGESMMKYVIVLFTRFDNWKRDHAAQNIDCPTIEGYINCLQQNLKTFLQRCSNRYIAFDNNLEGMDADHQVKDLLSKIECVVRENGGSHYTNSDYQEAERRQRAEDERVKQEQERERQRKETEIQRERERLEQKIRMEIYRENQIYEERLRREREARRRYEERQREESRRRYEERERVLKIQRDYELRQQQNSDCCLL